MCPEGGSAEDRLLQLRRALAALAPPEEREGEAVAVVRRPRRERDGGAQELLGLGCVPEGGGQHRVRLPLCRRPVERAASERDVLAAAGVDLCLGEAVAGREG